MSLSFKVKNADAVTAALEKHRNELEGKLNRFLERISTLGAYRARIEFTRAMYAGDNDVEVSVERTLTGYKVVARGDAVLFIEFGTGVINPEHPQSAEFGFAHGTYGKGKGANEKGWVYVGQQGNAGRPIRDGVYHTYGNPPAKAMYQAAKDMKTQIQSIAREVFG